MSAMFQRLRRGGPGADRWLKEQTMGAKFSLMIPATVVPLWRVAATEPGRFALHGVNVVAKKGEAVRFEACDGRMFLRATYEESLANVVEGAGSVILGADACGFLKDAAKALPKARRHDASVQLDVDGVNVTLSVPLTGASLKTRGIDGTFPPADDVLPKRVPLPEKGPAPVGPGVLTLADEYLPTVMQTMSALAVREKDLRLPIRFSLTSEKAPLRLDASIGGVTMVAAVMPMESAYDQPAPKKAKAPKAPEAEAPTAPAPVEQAAAPAEVPSA